MSQNNSNSVTVKRIKEVKGKMSQEQFAREINSSQAVVSKILSGDPPSISVLSGIAHRFNVSIDWLLGLSSRKSLNSYSTYDETNPLTYSDIIAFLIKLLKNHSITFKRGGSDDYSGVDLLFKHEDDSKNDTITINDRFIGDLIFSANSLLKTNPETVDNWLKSTIENYDIPLLNWSILTSSIYDGNIGLKSSLEVLNLIIEKETNSST